MAPSLKKFRLIMITMTLASASILSISINTSVAVASNFVGAGKTATELRPLTTNLGAKIWSYQGGKLVEATTTNFDVNQPTFIITHGWGGLYTNGSLDSSYINLADSLPAKSNILFVDWSADSNTVTPQSAASNIINDASDAYGELITQTPLGATPSLWQKVTMLGSSFGSYMNVQIAQDEMTDLHQTIGEWMGLDPANTLGLVGSNYDPNISQINDEIKLDFDNSISLHTYSWFDNQDPLGNESVLLLTPPSIHCSSHVWCLGSATAHGYVRTWLANCLSAHICTLGGSSASEVTGILEPNGSISGATGPDTKTVLAACADFEDSPTNTSDTAACSAAVAAAYKTSAVANFSGTWVGTYTTVIDTGTCGTVTGSGTVTLTINQSGDSLTGTALAPGDYFYWDDNCAITSRTNESDEWSFNLAVSGTTASGDGITLATSTATSALNGSDSGYDSTGYDFSTSFINLQRR